jgi:hypothetical protein
MDPGRNCDQAPDSLSLSLAEAFLFFLEASRRDISRFQSQRECNEIMKPPWLVMGAKGLHRRERRFPFLLLVSCKHNSSDCGNHVRFELVGDFQCSASRASHVTT